MLESYIHIHVYETLLIAKVLYVFVSRLPIPWLQFVFLSTCLRIVCILLSDYFIKHFELLSANII